MSIHDCESPGTTLPDRNASPNQDPGRGSLLITVEEVAAMWFGSVGPGGSASSNCQKIRRLIPDVLPARRIGNRWYVSRAVAESWIRECDPASVMAHPDSRPDRDGSVAVARGGGRS